MLGRVQQLHPEARSQAQHGASRCKFSIGLQDVVKEFLIDVMQAD